MIFELEALALDPSPEVQLRTVPENFHMFLARR